MMIIVMLTDTHILMDHQSANQSIKRTNQPIKRTHTVIPMRLPLLTVMVTHMDQQQAHQIMVILIRINQSINQAMVILMAIPIHMDQHHALVNMNH